MTEVHELIVRAMYCMSRGWHAAAEDALGRAKRILEAT